MKWSNTIFNSKNDKSLGNSSSRSISKFQRINLPKPVKQPENSNQLQRSGVKLFSVEKIKPKYHNKSLISNYANSSHRNIDIDASNNSDDKDGYKPSKFSTPINLSRNIPHLSHSNSEQALRDLFLNHNIRQQNEDGKIKKQNQSAKIDNQIGKSIEFPRVSINNQTYLVKQSQNEQNKDENKYESLIEAISFIFEHMKSLCRDIKNTLDKAVISNFEKFQSDMASYIQSNIKKIEQNTKSISIIPLPVVTSFQSKNTANINQDVFSKDTILKSNDELETNKVFSFISNKNSINKPNAFKNKFTTLLGNNGKNGDISGNEKREQKQKIQHPLRIQRKTTDPNLRQNSQMQNSSYYQLSMGNHINNTSIRYKRSKDRSASRSLKKIQQKFGDLKKMYNLNPS